MSAKKVVKKAVKKPIVNFCGAVDAANELSLNNDYIKKKAFTQADVDKAIEAAKKPETTYDKFIRAKSILEAAHGEVRYCRERLEQSLKEASQFHAEVQALAEELKFEAVASL